jgi:hypothetical protein
LEAKGVLEKVIKGNAVFGTTDHWTSRDGRAFESNSLSWIDNCTFSMKHADLDCREHKGTTDAVSMHKKYRTNLKEQWGIDLGRDVFVSLTTN